MPIVEEANLKELIVTKQISAISIDTSIFDQKRNNLRGGVLGRMQQFLDNDFDFILSETIHKEVCSHLRRDLEEAYTSVNKSIRSALHIWKIEGIKREDIVAQIFGDVSVGQSAETKVSEFCALTGCIVIDDMQHANAKSIFSAYFEGDPPFGAGKKKSEFPDAFALSSLENYAETNNIKILITSTDSDWKKYCENSERLYFIDNLETAL